MYFFVREDFGGEWDSLFRPVDCDEDVAERTQRRRKPKGRGGGGGGGEWKMEEERSIKPHFFERGVRGRLGGPGHASPLTYPVDIQVLPSRSEVAEADSLERMQGYRVATLTEFTFHSSPLFPTLPICIS